MDLQKRVTNILTTPKTEWLVIAAEPTDVASLYRNYIIILAAIPAIGTFLGTARYSLGAGLYAGVLQYVSSLIAPFVSAFIIEKLAPTFKSSGDTTQALKLVAYASTPMWLAGIFNISVFLMPLLLIAGLYGIYLFYLGLPPVMKTPLDSVVPYMVVAALVIIVVYIVLASIVAAISGPMYLI